MARTVTGTAKYPNGTVISGAFIEFVAQNNTSPYTYKKVTKSVQTGSDGTFTIALELGLYWVDLIIDDDPSRLGEVSVIDGASIDLIALLALTDATQNATVTFNVGITEGGTGATTASGARTNLGVVIGTDVQAYSAKLTAAAALAGDVVGTTDAQALTNKTISDDLTIGGGLFVTTSKTPLSATDTGVLGQIAWDASYIYVCIGTNIWRRAAIAGGW